MKYTEERLAALLGEVEHEEQLTSLIQGLNTRETRLVKQCQSHDTDESVAAFDQIITRHQDSVFAYIVQHASSPKQALRLSRNVFVKAYRLLSKSAFHGEMPLQDWLFTLARQELEKRQTSFLSTYFHRDAEQELLSAATESGEEDISEASPCTERLRAYFAAIHAPAALRDHIHAIIAPEPLFHIPSHQFLAAAVSLICVITFAALFLHHSTGIYTPDTIVKSGQYSRKEIQKALQTLEQQGISREQLDSDIVVIETGRSADGMISPEDSRLFSSYVEDAEKAVFMTFPGGIEHVKAEIRKNIEAVHGTVENLALRLFPDNHIRLLKVEANIPDNLDVPFPLLLFLEKPLLFQEDVSTNTETVTIYVFEKTA